MAFEGMDIGAVRSLAQQMRAKADEIQQIAGQLTSALTGVQWVGPDRERFVNDWQGQHVTALSRVCEELRNAAQLADQNATQQEQASGS